MQVKIKPIFIIIAIALVLILIGILGSQYIYRDPLNPEERSWLKQHPVIRLAPDPNFPPLEYFDDQGHYTGLIADYFKLIEQRLGIQIEYVHLSSWDEVLAEARAGEIDGITAAQITPERSTYLVYTNPILDIPNVVIVHNQANGNLKFEDMAGLSVAVTRGNALDEYIGSNYPEIKLVRVEDDLSALLQTSFNRVDATVVNAAIASYLIEKQGITNLRIAGDSGRNNSLAIAIRKDQPILRNILDKGLNSITPAEKNTIYSRWVRLRGNASTQFDNNFWLGAGFIGSVVVLIFLLVLLWNVTLQNQVHQQTMKLKKELEDRKLAEEKIQRQVARLSALQMIDSAISTSLNLKLVLHVFLEQTMNQLKTDAADILLLNQHNQILEYAAGMGFRTEKFSDLQLSLGESLAGQVAMQKKMVSIPIIKDVDSFLNSDSLSAEEFVSYYGIPLITKGEVKGVFEIFFRTEYLGDHEWLDFLNLLAGQAAIAIDNVEMFEKVQKANNDLIRSYEATIEGWSAALDLRDNETEYHSKRVTDLTVDLARSLGLGDEELAHIRRGALLHDIGKVGIPDKILLKPGPLDDEEWKIMRKHPVYAYELLAPIPFLKKALDIPYCHHEKWDGSGYPRGLKGKQIPLSARIFALVDVWDALRSPRPYRGPWPDDKIIAYIMEQSNKQFDPQIVDVFIKYMNY